MTAAILSDIIAPRGKPKTIHCNQGTEFTSMAMDHWAYWNKIGLSFSRPGKLGDNAHCEAFNSLVRRECLTLHYFLDIKDASYVLNSWKEEYNNDRPHGSLEQLSPALYRVGLAKRNDPERLVRCL